MKVKTNLKAGGIMENLTGQAKQVVSTGVNFYENSRQGVVDFGQTQVDRVRKAWQALSEL